MHNIFPIIRIYRQNCTLTYMYIYIYILCIHKMWAPCIWDLHLSLFVNVTIECRLRKGLLPDLVGRGFRPAAARSAKGPTYAAGGGVAPDAWPGKMW